MDFNLEQVRADVVRAKEYLQENKSLDGLKFLGGGVNGEVSSFDSACIKEYYRLIYPESRIDGMLELSKQGIKQDVKFAPYLDFLKRFDEHYSFMPKLEGPQLWDGKLSDGLGHMLEVGTDGIEKYISDYIALAKIGFFIDQRSENFIITTNQDNNRKHISFIDLQVFEYPKQKNNKPQKDADIMEASISQATHMALIRPTRLLSCIKKGLGPSWDKTNKSKVKELLHMTDTALKKFDHNTWGRGMVKKIQWELGN